MDSYVPLLILAAVITIGVPVFFYFTLKKIDKHSDSESSDNATNLSVTEKYIEQVVEVFNVSLEITDALDEIIAFLKERVRFSVGAYILGDSTDTLDFKANVFNEVSASYIDELQGKLLTEYKKNCSAEEKTRNFLVQRIVEGRSLPSNAVSSVEAILTFPIKIKEDIIGVFSVSSQKRSTLILARLLI